MGAADAGIEVNVVVDFVTVAGPIAAKKAAGIEVNNIVCEDETDVGFIAGALQLGLAVERENVVIDEIGFAVMLVETVALTAVNDVAFQHDSRTAFVGVKPPAAIDGDVHIVDEVIAENRAGLEAECVNAAHVAEHFLADIVEVIEFDDVSAAIDEVLAAYAKAER